MVTGERPPCWVSRLQTALREKRWAVPWDALTIWKVPLWQPAQEALKGSCRCKTEHSIWPHMLKAFKNCQHPVTQQFRFLEFLLGN